MNPPQAAIVVTGSELVRGDRNDLNGPYLARALVRLGVEAADLRVVGDDPAALASALRDGLERSLLVVSGGLGPTHDDRTVALIAEAAGLPLALDAGLEQRIETISRAFAERTGRPYADFAAGVRKQATLPRGAELVGLAGTAPAFLLETGQCVVVALPGPPRELQQLWPTALELPAFRRLLDRAAPRRRRVLRLYGASESAVARALAEAGGEPAGVEATICARDFEIHVDLLALPGAESAAAELERALDASLAEHVFARSEQSVEEIVLERCAATGLTLATAESCTGGLVAARLTAVPGASRSFLGAVVAYANSVKQAELAVPEQTLREHGAVSAETARAMAAGVRERLGADLAVSVTGIAGPDGGTPEKPVGLVHLWALGPAGERSAQLELPGDRETVQRRAAAAALHLLERLLRSA